MALMYINWNICTLLGLGAGRTLAGIADWGLDFAMVAAFIAMVLPYLKNRPSYATVAVAGVSALVLRQLPYQLGLISASLAGICAGMIAERIRGSSIPPEDSDSDDSDTEAL